MKKYDVYVVGAGLSGAVVARKVAEQGYRVKIVDRRNHIGGNMYDYYDEHGILVHKYGPHTFHTNKAELYDFMNKYAEWESYELKCGAEINGICTPTPFNFRTIDDFYDQEEATELKKILLENFPGRKTITVVEALKSANQRVRDYARFLFDNDYSLYTAKQWGVSASEIDVSVLERVPLRLSYEEGYFDDEFQVMPKTTYTSFFENILNHENITVVLNEEVKNISEYSHDECALVYTGALDELFDLKYGRLPYRSLFFDWKYEDKDSRQDMAVVAYPQEEVYTRIVEYKKLPFQNVKGTTYEVEYPLKYNGEKDREPYYPVLTESSKEQYKRYLSLAQEHSNLFLCGRLADFKYYNMDQALERALSVGEDVLAYLSEMKK